MVCGSERTWARASTSSGVNSRSWRRGVWAIFMIQFLLGNALSLDSQHSVEESHRIFPHEIIDNNAGEEPGHNQEVRDADRLEPSDTVRAHRQESATRGGECSHRSHEHRQQRTVETD